GNFAGRLSHLVKSAAGPGECRWRALPRLLPPPVAHIEEPNTEEVPDGTKTRVRPSCARRDAGTRKLLESERPRDGATGSRQAAGITNQRMCLLHRHALGRIFARKARASSVSTASTPGRSLPITRSTRRSHGRKR